MRQCAGVMACLRWRVCALAPALLALALLAAAMLSAAACTEDRRTAEGPDAAAAPTERASDDSQPAAPSEQEQSEPQPNQQASTAASAQAVEQSTGPSPQSSSQQAVPEAPQQASQQTEQSAPLTQSAQPEPPLESAPEGTRLITLFGDVTEIIYALGLEEYLVGRDASSVYPPLAEALPNLGFAGALNVEAILELNPSLVIGTPMAGPPGVLAQLQAAGVELLIIDDFNSLDAPMIKIRAIGEALGIPQRAEALALDVEQRMAQVTARVAKVEQPVRTLMLYLRRGGIQQVSGEGNKSQTIIEAAGGVDAAAAASIVGWQLLTPEALVAADPEVYLVMDLGVGAIGGLDALWDIPGVAETQAGRGRYVISMPDLYLLGFGPRLPEAIADLAAYFQSIHGELRGE